MGEERQNEFSKEITIGEIVEAFEKRVMQQLQSEGFVKVSYHTSGSEIKEALAKAREMRDAEKAHPENSSTKPHINSYELVLEQMKINNKIQKREALRRALQETMEIVLESELFTNAAKRGIEDYEFIVSHNIPMMVDLTLSRYENILREIG